MLTLTARPQKRFTAPPLQFTPATSFRNRSCGLRREPGRTKPRRTRNDVLHMLVGADSGQFPRLPRRRFVR